MAAARTTRPAPSCPYTGAARVEVSTSVLTYVLTCSDKSGKFLPRVELGAVGAMDLAAAQEAARTAVKIGAPGVKLAKLFVSKVTIEFACEDDAARADEAREMADNAN